MPGVDPLSGLPQKDFDEIFDETKEKHPNLPAAKLGVLVTLTMQIRGNLIRETERRAALRAELQSMEPSQELFQGWKLLHSLKGDRPDMSFESFEQDFIFLKQRKPEILLFHLPFWKMAQEHGAEYAQNRLQEKQAEISTWLEEQMKAEIPKLIAFLKTMSAPDDQKE